MQFFPSPNPVHGIPCNVAGVAGRREGMRGKKGERDNVDKGKRERKKGERRKEGKEERRMCERRKGGKVRRE